MYYNKENFINERCFVMDNNQNPNFNYAPNPQFQQPAPMKDNSTLALILGIIGLALPWVVSLFTCCLPLVGAYINLVVSLIALACSIVAMIMGIKARKATAAMTGKASGAATAGMILGIIGLALGIIGTICSICSACVLCTAGGALGELSDPSNWNF